MNRTFFDDSLPKFVRILARHASRRTIERNVFLRDAVGRLSFVIRDQSLNSSDRFALSSIIEEHLFPYADPDGFSVTTPAELFDETVADPKNDIHISIETSDETMNIKLIDRRVAGNDWLQTADLSSGIPRIVFASLKGGVGRSTALCVAAAAIAARGLRVVAIDMDVEAPGLGSMLLKPEEGTKLGLLDYLVETNLGATIDDLIGDLIAPSWLAAGKGVVDILPAIGSASVASPENVLAKIARAYVGSENGGSDGVTGRMKILVDWLADSGRYDVILIDARAGLHETTGAALLGLGAKCFLFGIDQAQTFAAYKLLLANLGMLSRGDWSEKIWSVQAKASSDPLEQEDYASRFRVMLDENLNLLSVTRGVDIEGLRDVFDVDWEDDQNIVNDRLSDIEDSSASRFGVCAILESELFRGFDPLKSPEHLSPAAYDAVYGEFLDAIFRAVDLNEVELLDG